jgi:propionate CoA-transferase
MLFIDFRQLTIASNRDIARIKAEVERHIGPLGHKVYAIVNYRDCRIEPAVQASYRAMVEALEDRCYLGVTRYGLSDVLEPDVGRSRWARHPAHAPAGWDDTAKSPLAVD